MRPFTSFFKNILFLPVAVFLLASPANAIVYYVKPVASGTGTGSSWANASSDLQLIINNCLGGDQVWVAAGTYVPTRQANNTGVITINNRNNAFVLKTNVKVYGGFNGTETAVTQRNWTTNVTILSGEMGSAFNPGDNCYHVVISSGNVKALLDGFTVRNGNANSTGNITVGGNFISRSNGGGIYIAASSLSINNCTMRVNSATRNGGAMYDTLSPTVNLLSCSFISNDASYNGGAMHAAPGSTVYTTLCIFTGNDALNHGGAVSSKSSEVSFKGGQLSDNSAEENGGAIFYESGSGYIEQATITGNTAARGGGVYLLSSDPNIKSCEFENNIVPGYGGALHVNTSPSLLIDKCVFKSNMAGTGSALYFIESPSLTIKNSQVLGNTATFAGGIRTYHSPGQITNCVITGNHAERGAGIYTTESHLTITNCTIASNRADAFGGGISNLYVSDPALCTSIVNNTILWGNQQATGGQIYGPAVTTTSNYSDIQGGYPGLNYNINPLFVSSVSAASAPTVAGDYQIQNSSPVINRGFNLLLPAGTPFDIIGNPRIVMDTVDIGAYEVQHPAIAPLLLTKNEMRGVSIYPNPVENGNVQIRLDGLAVGKYAINVFNSAGVCVATKQVQLTGKNYVQNLTLPSSIPAGIYTVSIEGQDKFRIARQIKY